jgi:hypothetical protein
MLRIRASIVSLGAGLLGSCFVVLLVIWWIAINAPSRSPWLERVFGLFCLVMFAYVLDGASESLTIQDGRVVFDGYLTRRREINLAQIKRVLLIHEGLNSEWGIETLTFTYASGEDMRLALGPLWRRRDLERFLAVVKEHIHDQKIVDEVR